MKRTNLFLFILTVILLSVFHHPVNASSGKVLDKPGVLQLLQESYDTQYSLTERYYSWQEAREKLSRYLTVELAEEFMVEHLFEEEEGYIFYGTDFSMYIIPEYSYTDRTKIVINANYDTIYVYEKSSSTGPVTYSPQYEIVTIHLMDGEWKVSDISFEEELPEEVKQAEDLDVVKKTTQTPSEQEMVTLPNVERMDNIPTGSMKLAHQSVKDFTIFPTYQPFAQVVPYHLLFQHANQKENRSLFLTFSTIFHAKGEVQ